VCGLCDGVDEIFSVLVEEFVLIVIEEGADVAEEVLNHMLGCHFVYCIIRGIHVCVCASVVA
jgi:hypothetical protein